MIDRRRGQLNVGSKLVVGKEIEAVEADFMLIDWEIFIRLFNLSASQFSHISILPDRISHIAFQQIFIEPLDVRH